MSPILTTSKLENKIAMDVGPVNFVTVIFMPSLFFYFFILLEQRETASNISTIYNLSTIGVSGP